MTPTLAVWGWSTSSQLYGYTMIYHDIPNLINLRGLWSISITISFGGNVYHFNMTSQHFSTGFWVKSQGFSSGFWWNPLNSPIFPLPRIAELRELSEESHCVHWETSCVRAQLEAMEARKTWTLGISSHIWGNPMGFRYGYLERELGFT